MARPPARGTQLVGTYATSGWGLPRRVARPSAQGYPLRHRPPGRHRLAALPRRWEDTPDEEERPPIGVDGAVDSPITEALLQAFSVSELHRPAMGSVVSRADRGWRSAVFAMVTTANKDYTGVAMQGHRRIPGRVRSCDNASSGACEVPAATSPPRSGGSGLFAPPRGHDQGRARERWPPGAPVPLATLEG